MAKSFLYEYFGFCRVTPELRALVDGQGVILEDVGIKSAVIFRNFRMPGRYSKLRRTGLPGTIFLTKTSLLCLCGGKMRIMIPFANKEMLQNIEVRVKGENKLSVTLNDTKIFNPESTGEIEMVFYTDLAEKFFEQYHMAK